MNKAGAGAVRSDALVLFGMTGDLAYKQIFPALYAMARQGVLDVTVVGVASSKWSVAQLRKRATDRIEELGRIDDRRTLRHLHSLLRYVSGDYNDSVRSFQVLKKALGDARRQAHYLAISPALFSSKPSSKVADATVRCLLRSVPAAVAGIAFLSGGQSSELASACLNAMNVRFKSRAPWALAFSFAPAIRQPAMEIWHGEEPRVPAAQQALSHRACNRAARRGQYDAAMEKKDER